MAPRQTSWVEADNDSGGHAVVSVTGVPAELSELAAEFPGYEFATQQTWDGISIIATRCGGCARPGLYAVVTDDLDEMRRVLLEQEAAAHQGEPGNQQPHLAASVSSAPDNVT